MGTIQQDISLPHNKSHDLAANISKSRLCTGWILSALPALFLLVDGAMKVAKPVFVVEATVRLGYPESVIVGLGILTLCCTALYLIPNTAVLGAILLTGYLGGAVATHVRVGEWFLNILFPVIFGTLIWGGLYLRDRHVAALNSTANPANLTEQK